MAVTGTGTQADPFIVHSYTEFISLSNHAAVENSSVYIQFFDDEHPNQTINCNSYGSEFKWGQFTGKADVTTFINLNGCTIKNLLIDENCAMFYAVGHNDTYPHWHAAKIKVLNGAILNIFVSAETSKIAQGQVEFSNVSFAMNTTSATDKLMQGVSSDKKCKIDNCALYWKHATLSTYLMNNCTVTDTDFELHIDDQNYKEIFHSSTFTDCRFQGKISGYGVLAGVNGDTYVFDTCGLNSKVLNFTNCVIDVDLTDSRNASTGYYMPAYGPFLAYNSYSINTNVICNSHFPQMSYAFPSTWNYMPHEGNDGKNIRNADYLNSKGFVVVQTS